MTYIVTFCKFYPLWNSQCNNEQSLIILTNVHLLHQTFSQSDKRSEEMWTAMLLPRDCRTSGSQADETFRLTCWAHRNSATYLYIRSAICLQEFIEHHVNYENISRGHFPEQTYQRAFMLVFTFRCSFFMQISAHACVTGDEAIIYTQCTICSGRLCEIMCEFSQHASNVCSFTLWMKEISSLEEIQQVS